MDRPAGPRLDGDRYRRGWRHDGTELVGDIREGNLSSTPSGLRNLQGTLLFIADDGIHGRELWKAVP